jgi:hypothetical protein
LYSRVSDALGNNAQGELVAFDYYHKRSKVLYDDGEEEWIALPRHTFCWVTPRARGAGAKNPINPSLSPLPFGTPLTLNLSQQRVSFLYALAKLLRRVSRERTRFRQGCRRC